jgi:hypothetical protein
MAAVKKGYERTRRRGPDLDVWLITRHQREVRVGGRRRRGAAGTRESPLTVVLLVCRLNAVPAFALALAGTTANV